MSLSGKILEEYFANTDTSTINEIKVTDITITFVSECYPRKLIQHLEKTKKYKISKYENGIYYVEGDIIPIQIIVKKKLSTKENIWLSSLTNKLTQTEQAKILLKIYNQHKTSPLYQSVMETITKNNRILFEKEDDEMCQTLEDIVDKRIEKAQLKWENRSNSLTLKLAEAGRMEDIIKAAQDRDYQYQLFEEFEL